MKILGASLRGSTFFISEDLENCYLVEPYLTKNQNFHFMSSFQLLPFMVALFLLSCAPNSPQAKFIVTTIVPIQDGKINDVLHLFKSTNPELVENENDWVKAVFSKNEAAQTVMVQAYWQSEASYKNFSQSEKFQNTMKRFGKYFKGKPEVVINEILFEM